MTNKQIGGNHYQQFPFQPTEFIHKMDLNFCQGNVIKYVCRYKFKNGLQDLEKALHYAEMLNDFYLQGYGKEFDSAIMEHMIVTQFIHDNHALLNILQKIIIYSVISNIYERTINQIKKLIKNYYNK